MSSEQRPILIVENDKDASDALLEMLKYLDFNYDLLHPPIKTVEEALAVIPGKKPEILFMDVELDDGNAFELLKQIEISSETALIMTTAHDKYAVNAFKFAALHYVLKPYDLTDIDETLKRVEERRDSQTSSGHEVLVENSNRDSKDMSLFLSDREFTHVVKLNEIISIEADGSYSLFTIVNGDNIIISKPIKYYDQLLSDHAFLRCHHGFLVNTSHIKQLDKRNGGELLMTNELRIAISQRRKEEIVKLLNRNMLH